MIINIPMLFLSEKHNVEHVGIVLYNLLVGEKVNNIFW